MAEGQRRRILDTGLGANILSTLTGSVSEQIQKRREAQEALNLVFKKALAEAQAKEQFPSGEERLNRLIFGLAQEAIPRSPTGEEAHAAVPSTAVAVPGPEGGVITGTEGEVAPGQPRPMGAQEALLKTIGFPRAQQGLEQRRTQATEGLQTLSRLGVGRLSAPSEFPSTATQKHEVQLSTDFESLREAVSQGSISVQDAVNALVKDDPELARKRGDLLEEFAIAVGSAQPANVRRDR